jgi:hypothetical protein
MKVGDNMETKVRAGDNYENEGENKVEGNEDAQLSLDFLRSGPFDV